MHINEFPNLKVSDNVSFLSVAVENIPLAIFQLIFGCSSSNLLQFVLKCESNIGSQIDCDLEDYSSSKYFTQARIAMLKPQFRPKCTMFHCKVPPSVFSAAARQLHIVTLLQIFHSNIKHASPEAVKQFADCIIACFGLRVFHPSTKAPMRNPLPEFMSIHIAACIDSCLYFMDNIVTENLVQSQAETKPSSEIATATIKRRIYDALGILHMRLQVEVHGRTLLQTSIILNRIRQVELPKSISLLMGNSD